MEENNCAAAGRTYTVGEFARLTGVTERTLRFYDRKGLLKPSFRNAQGHRIYADRDLLKLQKIVTLKFLDFSLEEIADHLGAPERELRETLDMQYELLKRKREQLERVLSTMERMRGIAEGVDRMDNSLLLLFIHNIHNEQAQKEALSKYLPESFVSAIFMNNMAEEDRLELERKMTAALSELFVLYRAGREPDEPEVLASGRKLLELLAEIIGPGLNMARAEEAERLEAWSDSALEQDPVISQIRLPEEEELFLAQVLERLNALDVLTRGDGHGG